MILFPAIDLKDGQCVRLYKGEMDQATVFNDNPAAQASAFVAQGCEWLHLVDLNGAFAGEPVNAAPVEEILKAVDVPVQLGGGIRDRATIEAWLDKGIRRVILGTIALRDPDFVREVAKSYPGQIVVGIDARGGHVAVEGWAETSEMTAIDLGRKFEDAGVGAIVYTDIDRDGTMEGLNVTGTIDLANALTIPVIASGGVASLQDLQILADAARAATGTIEGAISGRALYDGRLDIAEALTFLKGV
ncbi:MAG: 1-(5-phosphoribosyl)-5-[(5-phosphoribosylamino)methylideneamino]imidazole-4-carboxamide isomerase [Kordiimonas sp.]|nr:1-(5-phosphoribosyl)-5-[(5-phosphoribosylamino)methylideneamino]imidazole-4-carboxamide isomerase [Kordiimonas sp.]|tara:strand:+ start:783 stop:1520 length:738 start_codon:yes stop_codon:yes gene_type:complete